MAKRKESMMARQRRLLKEQRAKKANATKPKLKAPKALPPGKKGGALVKTNNGAITKSPGGKLAKISGKGSGLLTALTAGAAAGEAYKRTNRATAASGRGAGRATFTTNGKQNTADDKKPITKGKGGGQGNKSRNSGPKKVSYPVQSGKVTPKKTSYPTASETQRKALTTPPAKPSKPTKPTKKPTSSKSPRLPGKSVYDGKGGSSPGPKTKKPKSRLDAALDWASDSKNKDAWMGKKKKK